MEDYNAEIVIENRQKSQDGNERFTVKSPCKLMKKGKKIYIFYRDNGVNTKIKADEESVTVTRMGEFSSEMVYSRGDTFRFLYKMPYGTTEMELKTEKVDVNFGENGGNIDLTYELLFSGESNKNQMRISVRVI